MGGCRSRGTPCSATECTPRSSTRQRFAAGTRRSSTSACRTPDPTASGWALALRGAQVPAEDLALAWTLRGAPHAYRRRRDRRRGGRDGAVERGGRGEADLRRRQAAQGGRDPGARRPRPRRHDDARHRHRSPVAKGEMSSELTRRLDDPYLRWCNPCQATHTYEQPFRLSALQAGLELEPGTSPPVLHRIKGWRGPAKRVPEHLDLVRAVLHFLGPATPKLVAGYVDSPVKEVTARWPEDVETDRGRWRKARHAGRRPRLACPAPSRSTGRGCSAPSTCSCRAATASSWSRTWLPARTSGGCSAAPAVCSSAMSSSVPGGRGHPARS